MNAKEFFDLTASMRKAQKLYFSTPAQAYSAKQEALKTSKRLEAQIDAEIKRVEEIQLREKQKRENPMFPGFDDELLNKL